MSRVFDARLPRDVELPLTIVEDRVHESGRKFEYERHDRGVQKIEYEWTDDGWRFVGDVVLEGVEIEAGEPRPPAGGP